MGGLRKVVQAQERGCESGGVRAEPEWLSGSGGRTESVK